MAAISACVQDEKGMQIGERVDFSSHVLPGIADVRFLCLRYIDHYGDTIFNHLQIADLLSDFQLLFAETNLPDRHLIIRSLENLAEQSLSGVHLYLNSSVIRSECCQRMIILDGVPGVPLAKPRFTPGYPRTPLRGEHKIAAEKVPLEF